MPSTVDTRRDAVGADRWRCRSRDTRAGAVAGIGSRRSRRYRRVRECHLAARRRAFSRHDGLRVLRLDCMTTRPHLRAQSEQLAHKLAKFVDGRSSDARAQESVNLVCRPAGQSRPESHGRRPRASVDIAIHPLIVSRRGARPLWARAIESVSLCRSCRRPM